MSDQNDDAIMARWQELARKQDPDFDINEDSHAYLFANFLPEDEDEAWSLVPQHREIRRRIAALTDTSATPDEVGGVPMYALPSGANALSEEDAESLIRQHYRNLLPLIDESEYPDLHTFLASDVTVKRVTADGAPSDLEQELVETVGDIAFDAGPERDWYYALHECVTHLTMVSDVTEHILAPLFVDESPLKTDTFEPAFRLYIGGVTFWINDEAVVEYKIGE